MHADVLERGVRRPAVAARADDTARHRRALGASVTPSGAGCTPSAGRRSIPTLAGDETVTMVVQVNGKVRDRIEVDPSVDEDHAVRWLWRRPR